MTKTTKQTRRLVEKTLVPHKAFTNGLKKLEQCYDYAADLMDGDEPICVAVIGESRTGKSRLLNEFYRRHKDERDSEGRHVPILRVRTPSTATVGGFVEHMLEKIGDPSYFTGTITQKTTRLRKLLKGAGTRKVLVDEFQEFIDIASEKQAKAMTNWLKAFVEDVGIALIIAGLPKCLQVIDDNEQLAGRFLERVEMPRFNWEVSRERGQFMDILGAFSTSISAHFKLPKLDSDEMGFRFYCATGGLMGYVVKLLRAAVWQSTDARQDAITLESLAAAYEASVWRHRGVNPFDKKFQCEPSPELMALVASIGTGPEAKDEQEEVSSGPAVRSGRVASELRAR